MSKDTPQPPISDLEKIRHRSNKLISINLSVEERKKILDDFPEIVNNTRLSFSFDNTRLLTSIRNNTKLVNICRLILDSVETTTEFQQTSDDDSVKITNQNGEIKFGESPLLFNAEKLSFACLIAEKDSSNNYILHYPHLENGIISKKTVFKLSERTYRKLVQIAFTSFLNTHQDILDINWLYSKNPTAKDYTKLGRLFNNMRNIADLVSQEKFKASYSNKPIGAVLNGAWLPEGEKEKSAFQEIANWLLNSFSGYVAYIDVMEKLTKIP